MYIEWIVKVGDIHMNKYEEYKKTIMFIDGLVLVLLEVAFFAYIWLNYYNVSHDYFYWKGNMLVYIVYAVLIFLICHLYGGYKVGKYRKLEIAFSQGLSIICANLLIYILVALIDRHLVNPLPIIAITGIDCVLIIIWTYISQSIYYKLYPPRDMLLIYGGEYPQTFIDKISSRNDRYNITNILDIQIGLDYVCEQMKEYGAILIYDVHADNRNKLLKFAYSESIRTYLVPKISDIVIMGMSYVNLFDTALLSSRNNGLTYEERFIKRIVDIVCSVLLCIIASHIMIITAIIIKCYDGGPAIYSQERYTRDRKVFNIYKFRSMRLDAEKDGVARLASEGDSRITPVGRFIRKVRLDELPQLFNVIKGDMSIVGPRPERPEIAMKYEDNTPEFANRLKVKGGLTGYAQIYGKYNTTPYDKLKFDLMYIENYSIWLDFKLILLTFKILFKKESTEGISKGNTALAKEEIAYTSENSGEDR